MCLGRLQTGLIGLGDERLLEGRILRPPGSLNLGDSAVPLRTRRPLIQPPSVSKHFNSLSKHQSQLSKCEAASIIFTFVLAGGDSLTISMSAILYFFFPRVFCKPTGPSKLDASAWFFCGLSLLQTSGLVPRVLPSGGNAFGICSQSVLIEFHHSFG